MSTQDAEAIDNIERAVEVLMLAGVQFYELTAVRPDTVIVNAPTTVDEVQLSTETAVRVSDQGFDYRCRMTVEAEEVRLFVDGAALYRTDHPVNLQQAVLESFGDKVAIMTLIPYLRQAVADLALRLGFNVTLPIMQRGTITFALQNTQPDDKELASDASKP